MSFALLSYAACLRLESSPSFCAKHTIILLTSLVVVYLKIGPGVLSSSFFFKNKIELDLFCQDAYESGLSIGPSPARSKHARTFFKIKKRRMRENLAGAAMTACVQCSATFTARTRRVQPRRAIGDRCLPFLSVLPSHHFPLPPAGPAPSSLGSQEKHRALSYSAPPRAGAHDATSRQCACPRQASSSRPRASTAGPHAAERVRSA